MHSRISCQHRLEVIKLWAILVTLKNMTNEAMDVEYLELVVKPIVEFPDEVKIERTVDEMGVLLTLSVNAADIGKVIGRSGNTAKSIRILLRVFGMKHGSRINMKINEPEGGRAPAREFDDLQ